MEEKKKCKGNVAIVILSVLLVLSLLAGGYFYYKNSNEIKDLENELQDKNESTTEITDENEISKELKVETIKDEGVFVSKEDDIILNDPQIVNGTKVTKEINEKILKLVRNRISTYAKFVTSSAKEGVKLNSNEVEGADRLGVFTDYDYTIKNDVLLIAYHIKVGLPRYKTGNDSVEVNYAYDIKNDKEISITEALVKFGYTDEQMDKEMDISDVPKEAIENGMAVTELEKKKEHLNKNECKSYVSIDKKGNIKIVYVPVCL